MKSVNKIAKSNKLTEEQRIEQLMSKFNLEEFKARELLKPDFLGRVGFPDYKLTNNNAVIRNAKKRLEQVTKLKDTEENEYEVNGVRVLESSADNRFQIFFDDKPSEEVRTKLKKAGYRWSPTNGCWQCYLTSRWSIKLGKETLESL